MKSVLVLALFVCFFFVTLTAKTVDQTDILNAEAEGEMVRGSVLDGVLKGGETRDLDKQKNKNKKSKLKSKDKPDKVKKKNGKRSERQETWTSRRTKIKRANLRVKINRTKLKRRMEKDQRDKRLGQAEEQK